MHDFMTTTFDVVNVSISNYTKLVRSSLALQESYADIKYPRLNENRAL